MAYLVLARKYRPQTFADMTGQEHVVQTLSTALRTGRVAHALLFCGPRGCGKTTTARIVARALNCEKGPTPEPCGECTPCREITAGTDVDVQEIDAASNTGVDNVRELRESAKYLPARDRFKIFIVDEVHMLSKAAFNAFLKTLEEPPGHVKFIFATTDPRALPETILSRCQRHNFRLVPLKQISARLRAIATAESVSVDDGALALVARQAAGSMRDALSILDQLFSSFDGPIDEAAAARALGALDRGVIAEMAGALLTRDARRVLEAVARAHEGGHDLRRLAEDLAEHVRNLIAVSIDAGTLDLPDHEIQALARQSASLEPAELARLFDLVNAALFEISRAAQPRHALELALLKAIYLAPAASVQSLLARADELAQRLGGGGSPGGDGGGAKGGGGSRAPVGAPRWSAGSDSRGGTEAFSASPKPVPGAAPPASAAAGPQGVEPATRESVPPAPRNVADVARPAALPQAPAAPAAPMPAPAATPAVEPNPPPAAAVAPAPPPPTLPESQAAAAQSLGSPPSPASTMPASAAAGQPARASLRPWERHLDGPGEQAAEPSRPTLPPRPPAAADSCAGGPPPPSAQGQGLAGDGPDPARRTTPAGECAASAQPELEQMPPETAALRAQWPGLVESVRSTRKALASFLEHARPLNLAQDELTLGFVRGDLYARRVQEDLPALHAHLSAVLARPVSVRLVELSPEEGARTASLAELRERAETEARDARLRHGREHTAVTRAAALLGAEIEDVRDLGGSVR